MQWSIVLHCAVAGVLAFVLQGCSLGEVQSRQDAAIRFYCKQKSYDFVQGSRIKFEEKLEQGCDKLANLEVKGNTSHTLEHTSNSTESKIKMGAYIDLQALQCQQRGLEELELAFKKDYKKAVDECVAEIGLTFNASSVFDMVHALRSEVGGFFDSQLNLTASIEGRFNLAINAGFDSIDGILKNSTETASSFLSSHLDFIAGHYCSITCHDIQKTLELKWEEYKAKACQEVNATLQHHLEMESEGTSTNSSLKVGSYVKGLQECEQDVIEEGKKQAAKLQLDLEANCTAFVKAHLNVSKVVGIKDLRAQTNTWRKDALSFSASWEANFEVAINNAKSKAVGSIKEAETGDAVEEFELRGLPLNGGAPAGSGAVGMASAAGGGVSVVLAALAAVGGFRRLRVHGGQPVPRSQEGQQEQLLVAAQEAGEA